MMKNKGITILLVVFIGILTGCESQSATVTEYPIDSSNRFNGLNADSISIITDSETGCKYMYVEDGKGYSQTTTMAPLMKDPKTVDCE